MFVKPNRAPDLSSRPALLGAVAELLVPIGLVRLDDLVAEETAELGDILDFVEATGNGVEEEADGDCNEMALEPIVEPLCNEDDRLPLQFEPLALPELSVLFPLAPRVIDRVGSDCLITGGLLAFDTDLELSAVIDKDAVPITGRAAESVVRLGGAPKKPLCLVDAAEVLLSLWIPTALSTGSAGVVLDSLALAA